MQKEHNLEFDISYSFTMLPSETSYSRRALFSDCPPSKFNRESEEELFKNSIAQGYDKVMYFEKATGPASLKNMNYADFSSIGIIFYFIDQMVHSKLMNKSILLMNIYMYLSGSGLDRFLISLIDQGFDVYITSDHGNIFCNGNGVNVHKGLLDTKSRRYLISNNKTILEQYQTEYSNILQFPNLIGDRFLLLLTRDMYAGKKEKGLTHGGISIEEMIVPFIRVKRK